MDVPLEQRQEAQRQTKLDALSVQILGPVLAVSGTFLWAYGDLLGEKSISVVAALIALFTGLIAAWKWYEASRVDIDLGYINPFAANQSTYRRFGAEMTRQAPSGDSELQRINEVSATWHAMTEASRLNKVAALWTAASVVASAAAAIMGML